jgi:uncharacterized membrane protein YoaK (UPF0700 family)
MSVATEIARTLRPPRDDEHGPLVPLLLTLTIVTGVVDAVSYIKLGHVFVANMTGNIVFLAFAIAGVQGLSIAASLVALASFLAGGVAGGRLGARLAVDRGGLLRATVGIEAMLVGAAFAVALLSAEPVAKGVQYTLIPLLGLAMGVQNATARRLAVPDLTTTVVTLTLTGVAADSRAAGGGGAKLGRRGIAVTAMFVGALLGGLLAVNVSAAAPLAVAIGLLLVIAAGCQLVLNSPSAWTRPAG